MKNRAGISRCVVWLALCGVLGLQEKTSAQTTSKGASTKGATSDTKEGGGQPMDYKSIHFLLHTDLSPAEAKELLTRLETMLGLISKYWGKPPQGIIEVYVAKDLRNWPADAMDPSGYAKIAEGAGVTLTQTITQGNRFQAKATVYAVPDRGTPQHEVVHAYCGQNFGTTGPTWYSEGMAEMGQYWHEGDRSVNIHDVVLRYLKESSPKGLLEIVDTTSRTGDSWQNYAWRWALCHLLANNPNYMDRFHPLGMGLLTKRDVSFEQTYGAVAKEISFEYLFFLQHLEQGYRVDLCSWDWKRKFIAPTGATVQTANIEANKGWQPSSLKVSKGQEYEYAARGTFQLGPDPVKLTAAGDEKGQGKLVGIIYNDFTLSKPFDLGDFGTFSAPADGNLFLRCQDAWGSLSDNKGRLTVQLKNKGAGSPLKAPPK